MSQIKLHKIRQEVKEKELARVRNQWFKEYEKCRNVTKVCRMFGINRSKFYYWEKRKKFTGKEPLLRLSNCKNKIYYH